MLLYLCNNAISCGYPVDKSPGLCSSVAELQHKSGARVLARSARARSVLQTPQSPTPNPPFQLGLLQFFRGEFEGDNHPLKRYNCEGEKFLKNGKRF